MTEKEQHKWIAEMPEEKFQGLLKMVYVEMQVRKVRYKDDKKYAVVPPV